MSSLSTSVKNRQADLVAAGGVVVLGAGAGALGAEQPKLAVLLIFAGVYVGLIAVRPIAAAVIAWPALYAIQKLGFGLAGTDITIIVAALLALPALAHSEPLARLTPINRGFAVYVLTLVPTFFVHPTGAAGKEIFHRLTLVCAPAIVGAWLVQDGMLKRALRLYILTSAALSVFAIEASLQSGFSPAQPLHFHKNYLGSLLSFALLIVLCASAYLELPPLVRFGALLLIGAGCLACQSRGAVFGVALGVLLWLFSPGQRLTSERRGKLLAFVLAAGFAVFASYSVNDQLTANDRTTNSAGVRINVEKATRDLWRTSPVVGIGIRYFNTGNYGHFAQYANNAFDNELAESGVVGTLGFTALHGVVGLALWRRRRTVLGGAALAVFAGNFLHGQFDNYWDSGVTVVPFLLAGAALAAAGHHASSRHELALDEPT